MELYDRLLNWEKEAKRQITLFYGVTNGIVLESGTGKNEKTRFVGY